jgi:GT2 family glycosyltransferase
MAEVKKLLVSIVIVNWNGLEDTMSCLEHTKKQTYPNLEIIVVDNGSTDGSVQYLRKLKDIKLVENPKNLGFTGGHIAGYQASRGDFVLLLNNDAIMDPKYVDCAVEAMQADQKIGALGGRAYLWDDENELFDRTNKFYSYQNINPITAEGIFSQHDEAIPQEVNNVSGSCVMVRRSVIDEVGYLHNPFFAYFEESDLFARMKRAGYKVIYDPELAIWHANAKTSNRKAPTFFYYMIMRNRFRFAVRNFDNWSLMRFLKFYLKMGLVSILKSLLPLKNRPMHRAYAKAFFYNLTFSWKAFSERQSLKRALGKSNYNSLIVREQTGISLVVVCDTLRDLGLVEKAAANLKAMDEIVVVSSSTEIIDKSRKSKNETSQVRLCIDRGYFATHQQNLGAVVAKNEWVALVGVDDDLAAIFKKFGNNLPWLRRKAKKLASISSINSYSDALNEETSHSIFFERSLFIDAGGLDKSLSAENAIRELLAYGLLTGTFAGLAKESLEIKELPRYTYPVTSKDLKRKLSGKFHLARIEHKEATLIDKIANRYYRVAQLRNLLIWLFSFKIPARLKAARLKNLILYALRLNRFGLATEIKHMRNEVYTYRDAQDLVAKRRNETKRLGYLLSHPLETALFIILRDRYEPLKQLMQWVESQNLKKIIFIDNDSKLPPLIDYLDNTGHQVLELRRNMAQTAPWSAGIIKILLPDDFYIVTDPDIIPARQSKDVITHLYNIHKRYPHHLKIGLGLKIDDLPDHYPLKGEVIKWESQFWKHPVGENVYEAGVDTTFALYKPGVYKYLLHPGLRTGEPYTARHLPWYSHSQKLTDEDIFYRLRADQSVNSWDKDHLPERYKKEFSKQG